MIVLDTAVAIMLCTIIAGAVLCLVVVISERKDKRNKSLYYELLGRVSSSKHRVERDYICYDIANHVRQKRISETQAGTLYGIIEEMNNA